MKSKSILLAFLIGCNLILSAQNISVASFKMLVGDMTTTSMEGKRIDQNNEVAALIRVVTPETGFAFEAGALGVVDTKQKVGEIWVWVPRGSRRISIMHQQLGVLRDYRYPIEIEADRTYEMVLTTDKVTTIVEKEIRQQYLTFEITPANAMLEVDGQLWEVGSDGTATKFVDFGTYKYRVQAPNHHPDAGMVTVDGSGKTQKVTVNLKPDFVTVTLNTEADAEIWVNNERKGEGSWTGPLGKGIYMIECKKANHETTMTSQEITAAMNGQTITLPAPQPIYGSLNIESIPNYASVYLDGKPVGETPLFIKEILIGSHELKLTKEGHGDHAETITITKGERKQVKAELNNEDYFLKGKAFYDQEQYSEAFIWFRKAAEQGDAIGQNNLGWMYASGLGVAENNAEAVKWYRKAAEQGNARAQCNLGNMYEDGRGVTQSYEEAVKWYRKAADQGFAAAQYNLGLYYENGNVVKKDLNEALKWYRKAAEQGDEEAEERISRLEGITNGISALPEGALPSVFSISATKKVYFSKGNLQYQASTNTWRFAEHQWDHVGTQTPDSYYGRFGGTVSGSDNNKISKNYSGWIDLFGWGTGNDPTKSSKDNSDYSSFTDWGSHMGKEWRTLTKDEWAYVINERNTISGIRFAKAKVNGVNGVILLPDNWNSLTYSLDNPDNKKASFDSNPINASIWNSTFAPAGAVFLPAAGHRFETSVNDVGGIGSYNSSTKYVTDALWGVSFGAGYLHASSAIVRSSGSSVRLVCPVQ